MPVPTITPLPTAPSRQDPATFSTRTDAFLAGLETFAEEANILAADVNNTNITQSASASASAATATTKAAEAAASALLAQQIVGVPPAFTSLIMQPNNITTDITIPDGYNAAMFGDFVITVGKIITCQGNSEFIII